MPSQAQSHRKASTIREKELLAMRNGVRPLVRFPNGNTYVGEWVNDLMHGKGTLKSVREGTEYFGDFANGMKEGFGTLSQVKDLSLLLDFDPKTSSNKNKAVTAVLPDDVPMRKVYVGFWSEDLYHGEGTLYGEDEKSFYQGQFIAGLKHGFGREQNAKGDVYDGAWKNNLKNGKGIMKFANSDVYEGMWVDGKKHGQGKFIYTTKARVYEGEWVNDVAKFGQMSDLTDSDATNSHLIPELTLAHPDSVLDQARQDIIGEKQV